MGNAEIKDIVDIMGLKFGTVYDETDIKNFALWTLNGRGLSRS